MGEYFLQALFDSYAELNTASGFLESLA